MRFSVGVNYWPRRSGPAMWRRFDAGEIAEDFARIAALGLDTVRLFLQWEDFQPRADEVDAAMLDRLTQVCDLAAERGLRAMPVLFSGHLCGANWLPAWTLDRSRPRGAYRTIAGGSESPYGAGNIYAGPLLDAQVFLARAAGVRLREHPAITCWDIGHRFSDVRAPRRGKISTGDHGAASAAEPEIAEWSRRLTAALAESSGVAATAGTFDGDLTADREIRLGSLCAPFAFASMQGSTVTLFFARNRLDPEVVPFLAMLAAGFSHKPVIVTCLGNPRCPRGKFSASERFATAGEPPEPTIVPDDPVFATYPCLTEDESAMWCTQVLERLHADGRLGAYWWCWTDCAGEQCTEPPFDRAPHEGACGIIRGDGSERPVAAALAAFAAQHRTVVPAEEMPLISATYYYRTLPTSARTLYDAFLGFVEERRAAMQ
jgi:hypothetical protein